MDQQINSVVKSSLFFLLKILSKVEPFLSFSNFWRVIHAFVSIRLDYCNALYVGVSQASLSQLQLVQNAAARLLTGARRQEHTSLVIESLHWIPVFFRIHFEILSFTFKALNGMAENKIKAKGRQSLCRCGPQSMERAAP